MDKTNGNTWILYALLSALFAALTNIFAKMGVVDIPSNMAMWIRVVTIISILTPLVIIRGEWVSPTSISIKPFAYLILSGVATGVSWLAYFRAIQIAPLSLVAPVDKLSVALVMVLGFLILGERLSPKEWLGTALIIVGIAVIAYPAASRA